MDSLILALDWLMARLPLPECGLDFGISEAARKIRKSRIDANRKQEQNSEKL